MLDLETLKRLPDLMASTLYQAEVNHLPRLSHADEQEVIARARQSDKAARMALIVNCLAYALGKAIVLFLAFRPAHEEALDLVQVASEAMVKRLDYALAKENPVPYLKAIAKKTIQVYLLYNSDLIRKPSGDSLAELAKKNIPNVESLDTPAFRESSTLKIDLIEMAPPPVEKREEQFAPLYNALKQLTPIQRQQIAKTYGVGDLDPDVRIYGVHPETLTKLRKALEPYLKQMLE